MDIDERLEFLRQSTESLHAACQELHAIATKQAEDWKAEVKRLDERERRSRRAVTAAIAAYFDELNEDENGQA